MQLPRAEFVSAVLLVSRDPARLATFYRDALGLPLEAERHGDTREHFGCELGDTHFAIHPVENFGESSPGVGAVRIAFEVFDLAAMLGRLAARGIVPAEPPKSLGQDSRLVVIRDPDGNPVELTQMSRAWLDHLRARRAAGHDPLQRWTSRAQPPPP